MTPTIRASYRGGPFDGRVDILPANDDGPAHQLVIEDVDLDALLEWSHAGALGDPPIAGHVAGAYRWVAHVAPPDGPSFELYHWREGRGH